ncbi:unnamed protein product [Peronospora destructor]|uniref:Kri1-like C-terminal domain-containing protein n=1 Tax=Peronospora destructor TaxID=86335 RepID=A0AAV0V2B8_9STRA|nr:unnamed protein product [Peronospora destructor]
MNEIQRQKQNYLDELYSLDYEDLIGDIKCRFKYRQVQNNDFGLTVDEIMAANDNELKQLVSLKRMAPYADSEYFIDRKRLKSFKKSKRKRSKKKKAMEEEAKPEEDKTMFEEEESIPKRTKAKSESAESAAEKASVDIEKKKRRSKKKRSGEKNVHASTGLPTSRLESYKLVKATKN